MDDQYCCPHYGRVVNLKEMPIGNYAKSDGWTEAIVQQAAKETGLNIYVGKTTHDNSSDDYVGLWRQDKRDLGPFFDKAKELREAKR